VQLEKVACWSTKVAISLKRVKVEEKLLWRAYRKSSTLFRMVTSATPTTSSSLRVHNPQPKLQSLLSQERLKLRISNVLCTFRNFQGTHKQRASCGHLCDRPTTL